MNSSEQLVRSNARLSHGTARTIHPLLPLGLFLAAWYGQFFVALVPGWRDGQYYEYGFLTPFVLFLIYLSRWKDQGSLSRAQWQQRLSKITSTRATWVLFALSLLVVTLCRFLESIDVAWRAPLYLHGLAVILFAGYLHLRLLGFRHWKGFLSIAALLVLSIPLPTAIESSVIHGLTQQVVEAAAIAARWLGIPLVVAGETLILEQAPLHIAEGCSGIRSFQSSIYGAFLLGEILRLSIPSRISLLLTGMVVAFLSNCVRVVFLITHAAKHGTERLSSLHDISGAISMAAMFVILAAFSFYLQKRSERPVR